MDFTSPPLIALYIILGAFVVAFLYMNVFSERLVLIAKLPNPNPDTFDDKKHKKTDGDAPMKPLYPQRVSISGYDIKPQPHNLDVSNELVKATIRENCSINAECCSL